MLNKVIIYERTSTREQQPELQHRDNVEFCKEKQLIVVETRQEQGSAWKKNNKREVWDYVTEKAKKEKLSIVLWRYDRAFRNREEFYKFMKVMFEVYGVKVYSVKEPSILSFWDLLDKNYSDNPVMNELFKQILQAFWNFLIQQAGEQAEEESTKKSQRVKLAVVKQAGQKTKSYKGNVWGRRSLSNNVIARVLELHKQGLSIRSIAKECFYYDKNNNKKSLSKSAVHKILADNSNSQSIVNGNVQDLSN